MIDKSLIVFLVLFVPIIANAEIPITLSDPIINVKFDGKWTSDSEWKSSTVTEIKTNDGPIYIRTAHNGDFIYVLLDVIPDKTLSKGSDKSIICFENRSVETKEQKNYCFSAAVNIATGKTLESNAISVQNSNYKLIKNSDGFFGIGGFSDENNRYTNIPHANYEYRIPIDLFGRSNVYGFYVYVLDHDSRNVYTWPPNILDENQKIPSSEKWGTIISLDKTLPEFHLGIVLLLSIIPVIVISYFRKNISFQA